MHVINCIPDSASYSPSKWDGQQQPLNKADSDNFIPNQSFQCISAVEKAFLRVLGDFIPENCKKNHNEM